MTLEPDTSRFLDVKNGEVLTFGTIRIRGHEYPFSVPKTRDSEGKISHHYTLSPICICDSKDKKKYDIQWVKAGNLLVADRNLLKNVSWEQLDTWGLVFGDNQKPIHKEPRKQSFEDLVSRAQSISDQLAELTSDLEKHKNNLER